MVIKQIGVTLIELIIVVAIIGIIAAFAYPTYQNHINRANRGDAVAAMMGLASMMERRFTENNSYCDNGTTVEAGCGGAVGDTGAPIFFGASVPNDGGPAVYNLTIEAVDNASFTIQATRTGLMANDDCGDYQLNQLGQRTNLNLGGGMTVADCW